MKIAPTYSPLELVKKSPFLVSVIFLFCVISIVTFSISSLRAPIKNPKKISDCVRTTNPYPCYEKFLVTTTKEVNPEKAFALLKEEAKHDPFIERNYCHELSHAIGRTAAQKYKTFAETNAHADDYCSYGYYHGMVGTLVVLLGKEHFQQNVNLLCDTVPGRERKSFDYFTCVHGIGHGTTILSYYDLPEALKLCDVLGGTWEQEQCYNGAFMENLISQNKDHQSSYVKDDDPLFPCTIVEEKYREQCYQRQPRQFLNFTGWDFAEAFLLCSSIEEQYRAICYQGMGREAFSLHYNDIPTTRDSCDKGGIFEQRNNCNLEAVKYFIDFTRKKESGDAFCESLSDDLKPSCFASAEKYAKTF